VRTRHSWSWSCGRAHRAPTDRQSAGWHRGLASGHRNLMRTTMASSAPAAPCADDAGLCWLGGSLSFFEEHTTAVCAIARLRIQRRRLLRLPTITTLRGRRRGAAESGTRKCPWRAEAWRPGGGPTPPMGEAMACTAPHTRPRVGATTRPRSTTVSRVCWTRCQQLACNAKRALHGSKAQRRPRSLFRSRAYETDRSPAIGQRSYAQPIVPAAPAPSAPSCSSSVPS
jgi:hypothetical protein